MFEKITLGKVLTGVAIGVGAVAAAPFTGGGSVLAGATALGSLAGAGTVAAAVGAGAVGAGVGAKLSYDESKEQEKAEIKQSKQALRVKKIEKSLSDVIPQLKEQENYFNLLKAMTAVGIACANCDGYIAVEEKESIDEYIGGIMNGNLPSNIKKDIDDIYKNPPRLKVAFEMVQKVQLNSYELFDGIIDITMDADGIQHEKEIEFKQDWEQLKRVS